ncbi:rubredoxin-like domain-containing protein [Haloplanus sp. GCM10025708]|uniref:DUF7130 family rubredoxin-like protein n=1 Tax=Haloferacaceae TaxID=1644056 RepID=UPI00361A9F36
MADENPTVPIGTRVYDGDGEELGSVRGITDDGFVVSTRGGVEALSIEHERAGHEYGEGVLMWRCNECGAMGDIEDLPDACPDCGAPTEDIYYAIED